MITATLQPKKKLIDLKEDTFKALSVMALQHGTNLKHIIETILDNVAENHNDTHLYELLSKSDPEGKEAISQEEKADFENWLGV